MSTKKGKSTSSAGNSPSADLAVSTTPWRRCPGESREAHNAFEAYRDLPGKRSLEEAARRCKKSESLLARWSGIHQWGERIEAYDVHMEQIRLEEAERLAKQKAQEWARREQEQREEKYLYGGELLQTSKTINKFPLTDQKVVERYEDGREKTIQLKGARWAKRDAVRFAERGFALRDQAIRNEGATPAPETQQFDEFADVDYVPESKRK